MGKRAGYHIDRSLADSSEDFTLPRGDGPVKKGRNRPQSLYGESDEGPELYQTRPGARSPATP